MGDGPYTGTIILNVIVLVVTLLLMFVILIQRGKGGGLIGALGGVGGSSPFGSRAGDTFTEITLYMALVWGLLIVFQTLVAKSKDMHAAPPTPAGQTAPADNPS